MLLQHDLNKIYQKLAFKKERDFNATLARFKQIFQKLSFKRERDFNATLARFKLQQSLHISALSLYFNATLARFKHIKFIFFSFFYSKISMLLQHDLNFSITAEIFFLTNFNATLARFKPSHNHPLAFPFYPHISMLLQHDLNLYSRAQ